MVWILAAVIVWLAAINTFLAWRLLSRPAAPQMPVRYEAPDVAGIQQLTEYLHGDTDELPEPTMPVGFDG